jgi:hypothetical protein
MAMTMLRWMHKEEAVYGLTEFTAMRLRQRSLWLVRDVTVGAIRLLRPLIAAGVIDLMTLSSLAWCCVRRRAVVKGKPVACGVVEGAHAYALAERTVIWELDQEFRDCRATC